MLPRVNSFFAISSSSYFRFVLQICFSLTFAFIHREAGKVEVAGRHCILGAGRTGGNKAEVGRKNEQPRRANERGRKGKRGRRNGGDEEWTSGESPSSRAPDLD